jgi:uncharacterized membrane protein YbhN (UPF0104 family)
LLGFLSYSFNQLFCFLYSIIISINNLSQIKWITLTFWTALQSNKDTFNFSEILFAALTAIIQSMLMVKAIQNKWLHKFAKAIKFSFKYGEENLYSYILRSDTISWLYVRDIKNDITYLGVRDSFSETDKFQELVLTSVSVFRYSDSSLLYKVNAVYLSFEPGSMIIEVPSFEEEKENGKNS